MRDWNSSSSTDGAFPRATTLAFPPATSAEQGQRLAAKFDALVAPVLGAPRARELRETIADLDNLTDIGSLARLAAG